MQSKDVAAAVEALVHAITATQPPRLERLEVAATAHLVLPSGALLPVALLAEPQGQQLLQERWPGLQLHRQQHAGDAQSADWLLLTWPPQSRR